MAAVVQFGNAREAGEQLDPAVKEFLDEVVIPALVKKFLSEPENRLAVVREDVPQCERNSASVEGVR